jgi:hypothetical protein
MFSPIGRELPPIGSMPPSIGRKSPEEIIVDVNEHPIERPKKQR